MRGFLDNFWKDGRLNIPWWLWLIQGGIVALIGVTFAMASLFNMDVVILSTMGFSWLPILALLIMLLGILECLDAIFSREICDFMQRMNSGVLDIVFGGLLLFGISDSLEQLTHMIALYLLTQSVLRAVFAIKLRIPQLSINLIASLISFGLGLTVWLALPTEKGWFLSFCLSVNLLCRGILMFFYGFHLHLRGWDETITTTDL